MQRLPDGRPRMPVSPCAAEFCPLGTEKEPRPKGRGSQMCNFKRIDEVHRSIRIVSPLFGSGVGCDCLGRGVVVNGVSILVDVRQSCVTPNLPSVAVQGGVGVTH